MKNLLYPATCLALLILTSGCSSTSCQSWLPSNLFANRPTPIRDLFRGDACSTCNPPLGQPSNCGTNLAPACSECGGNVVLPEGQPIYAPAVDQGIPLYGNGIVTPPMQFEPNLGAIQTQNYTPDYSTTDYSGAAIGSAINPKNSVSPNLAIDNAMMQMEEPPMYGTQNIVN